LEIFWVGKFSLASADTGANKVSTPETEGVAGAVAAFAGAAGFSAGAVSLPALSVRAAGVSAGTFAGAGAVETAEFLEPEPSGTKGVREIVGEKFTASVKSSTSGTESLGAGAVSGGVSAGTILGTAVFAVGSGAAMFSGAAGFVAGAAAELLVAGGITGGVVAAEFFGAGVAAVSAGAVSGYNWEY
jgi:hypothetical protein